MKDKELMREKTRAQMDTSTRLAYDRTYLAQERTQMAWIRTALSLISFGFGIAKFFQYLQEQKGIVQPLLGARTVGQLMIMLGIVCMVIASIQHKKALKVMRDACPDLPPSLSGAVAGLISVLGILAMIGAILRS